MSTSAQSTHRTKLLEAARTLLRERTYGNITARDLVAASNTNLGSIGYHFGSKEALLNEAIGLALEEWVDAIIHAIRIDPGPGPLSLTDSLGAVLDEYDSIRPYYHAYIEALARSARSPELRTQLAGHYNRQRDRVAGLLMDSLHETIDPGDARHLASAMIATVDGLLIQTFIDADNAPTSHDLATATGRALTPEPSDPGPQP
ncbi:MAG: TetR/AcrR family transcriptional regulator [Solirubrobacterales bacterium]|nr:TetR/AcrR family transcriptional regulator [Solirubrobacterales bacterium]